MGMVVVAAKMNSIHKGQSQLKKELYAEVNGARFGTTLVA